MKQYLYHITYSMLLCCVALFSSCTDNEENSEQVKPGVYTVEMTIETQREEAQTTTRGIVAANNDFDLNYDGDSIFLHAVGSEYKIELPVYSYNCDGETCEKGLRYRIEVLDDKSAIITPIDAGGNYDTENTLTLSENQECYFSSWPDDVWSLDNDQFYNREGYNFYQRKNTVNVETYRSRDNFKIATLQSDNNNLVINRACAGFNAVGLFYDNDKLSDLPSTGGVATLTSEEFENIMGTPPSQWYIKIFIGGASYTNEYSIEDKSTITGSNEDGGYYSSGDAAVFAGGIVDKNQYLQFAEQYYGYGSHYLQAYGYYTRVGNQLFTPVTGEEVSVYILIKHWPDSGNDPDDDWLYSDTGALQTQMNITGGIRPVNNCFYILGLLMDIRQFKEAWDTAGEDEVAATTRSSNGIREFTLKDAKVIYEVY